MKFVPSYKGMTTNFFHPSLLHLFLDPGSEIRDPGWVKKKSGSGIRDKLTGSATLLKISVPGPWHFGTDLDPDPRIPTSDDPDPALFVRDLQDARKIFFLHITVHLNQSSQIKRHKEIPKQLKSSVFLLVCLMMGLDQDPNPDPYRNAPKFGHFFNFDTFFWCLGIFFSLF